MSILIILANIGAIATFILGIMGLVAPGKTAAFVSMIPKGNNGISEVRATYGGLFFALGFICLYCQMELVFTVAGVAWLGAGLGRLVSLVFDKNTEARNLGGIVLELGIGVMLAFPRIATWI